VEVNSGQLYDSEGRRLTLVVIRDIRERLKRRRRCGSARRSYRRVIAASDAVAYQVEEKTGRYTFISDEIAHLTGYSAHEITAHTWNQMEGTAVMRGGQEGLSYRGCRCRCCAPERWTDGEADYRIRRNRRRVALVKRTWRCRDCPLFLGTGRAQGGQKGF